MRKRINHLEKHLAELKDRYKILMGRRYYKVINSDDEKGFSQIKLENPQDKLAYVKARPAARAAIQVYDTIINESYDLQIPETKAKTRARAKQNGCDAAEGNFGASKGDFNG